MLPGCLLDIDLLADVRPRAPSGPRFGHELADELISSDVTPPLTASAASLRSSGPPGARWRAAFLTLFGHLDMDRHITKMTG